MIQTAIFVLTFSLRIAKGINSSLYAFLSQLKREEIEIVIPYRIVAEKQVKSLDMMDYLREQKEKGKTQQLNLHALSSEKSELFLN